MLQGTIVKGIGGFYYVKTAEGLLECRARGHFRKAGESPVVGDLVTVRRTAEDSTKGSLEEIMPRKNVFIRPPVANIDQLVITLAVGQPEPNLLLIDQLAVTAEKLGVTPVICINKLDLDEARAKQIATIYETAGYKTVMVSAKYEIGTDELIAVLQDKITAFAGNSGVGKSTLLNRFCSGITLETGGLSEKTKRGRHTTRHSELLELPFGGYVLDTPGFSSYAAEGIRAEELASLFPEIAAHSGTCRFSDCAHVAEIGCAVKEALSEGKIAQERYDNYCALYLEAKKQKQW